MIDMCQVWKEKIYDINEKIKDTESGKDGRLKQLAKWKTHFEKAYVKCLENKS